MVVRPGRLCVVAAALLGAACQGLVGIEDSLPARPDASAGGNVATGGTAGTNASGGAAGVAGSGGISGAAGAAGTGSGVDAGCNSAEPPIATAGADPGGDIEFVVAVRSADLGDGDSADGPGWRKLGYDLDKLCTCVTDSVGSCKPSKQVVCDGDDGRDNALGSMMYSLKGLLHQSGLSSDALNARIEAGGNTVLFRIRGYNGTANDAAVEVAWFASDSFSATNPGPPKWDGTDAWPVQSSSLEPTTGADGGTEYSVENPKYVDKAAYVANGTLVASLPSAALFLTTRVAMKFTAALVTAKVQAVAGGGWTLQDSMFSGITTIGNVLAVLPSLNDPLTNQPICTDSLVYGTVKSVVCQYPDMTILGNPTKPCDHVSLGFGASGVPAKVGAVTFEPPAPNPCAAGKDPADDSC